MTHQTDNLRISQIHPVDPPARLVAELPITDEVALLIENTRQEIHRWLQGKDDRLLVIVGPCSIHDVDAALEYAKKLVKLREQLKPNLLVVMRVYFEKPRTRVGWKGLINDPDLNNTFNINKGLRLARKLLLEINKLGLPAGTEFLDIVTGQYISDLISWGAIGARTTESQVHREMASGLSCPVGFKNGTDGNLLIACDAMIAAREPHIFLSPTETGNTAIFTTTGNSDTHVILRGGAQPNYDVNSVTKAVALLKANELPEKVMIDCSHANSQKNYLNQLKVGDYLARQISDGNPYIAGVMLESFLVAGRQDLAGVDALIYGQSITDACLDFDNTKIMLNQLSLAIDNKRRKS